MLLEEQLLFLGLFLVCLWHYENIYIGAEFGVEITRSGLLNEVILSDWNGGDQCGASERELARERQRRRT